MSQIVSQTLRDAAPIDAGVVRHTPELSIVIPTYKEGANIAPLLRKLDAVLAGIGWEAIIVDDDSPDGTSSIAKEIAASDPRIRCLRRVNRRGLAGACIEGILSSAAPYVAVMDADLQHDETLLPRMLASLKGGESELVVGSRYAEGGNTDAFSRRRDLASRLATVLARRFTHARLSDPLSGFFMMRRDRFDPIAQALSTQGFKVLLDILITTAGRLRIVEIPYSFGARAHGESKLDAQVGLDFLGLLLAKFTGGLVTPRFLSFAMVGAVGLGVHLAILRAALAGFDIEFTEAQAIATVIAMTGNFFLNNLLTYRDRRLSGAAFAAGLLKFYLISAIGALANVGVASWVYTQDPTWWVAGASGALMGAVWNYSMSTLLVWRVK
jgi:dolichol-phosphate mannosyltransferase